MEIDCDVKELLVDVCTVCIMYDSIHYFYFEP